jgi:hypothetical protein
VSRPKVEPSLIALTNAADLQRKWLKNRDQMIVELRSKGHTFQTLANAARMSPRGVQALCERHERDQRW